VRNAHIPVIAFLLDAHRFPDAAVPLRELSDQQKKIGKNPEYLTPVSFE